MENTTPRLFIISFGDSPQYRVEVAADDRQTPFVKYEQELNSFLNSRFPGGSFTYYTTPRIREIDATHAADYASYPEFDAKAMEAVKQRLLREVQVMNADRELNSDAPWSN